TGRPDANTHLGVGDVFYFSNAIGDSGNSSTDARVNVADEVAVRVHPANPAQIDDPYDFDRDKNVNATDGAIAHANPTSFLTALKLIGPSGGMLLLGGTSAHVSVGLSSLSPRLSISPMEGGFLRLELVGHTGIGYEVEASEDLSSTSWHQVSGSREGNQ